MNNPHPTLITLDEELRLEFLALAEDYLAAGEDRYRSALTTSMLTCGAFGKVSAASTCLPTGSLTAPSGWMPTAHA